jgi:outer membrane lipoprotein-sorting protein
MGKNLAIILVTLLIVASTVASCKSTGNGPNANTTSTSQSSSSTSTSADTFAGLMGLSSGITNIKYTMVMAGPEGSMTTTSYIKNNKIRQETNFQGATSVIILDKDAQVIYSYIPAQNMAIKQPYNPSSSVNLDAAAYQSSAAKLNPVYIKDETYDGKVCAVYQYNDSKGSCKMWVWKTKGLSVKIETTTSTGTNTIEFKNYDFSDIPDSMFKLPAGVQIVDQGSYTPN